MREYSKLGKGRGYHQVLKAQKDVRHQGKVESQWMRGALEQVQRRLELE